jgi:hypothetical protein
MCEGNGFRRNKFNKYRRSFFEIKYDQAFNNNILRLHFFHTAKNIPLFTFSACQFCFNNFLKTGQIGGKPTLKLCTGAPTRAGQKSINHHPAIRRLTLVHPVIALGNNVHVFFVHSRKREIAEAGEHVHEMLELVRYQ